jgi:hypothetical protein
MAPGEYAVHFSEFADTTQATQPFCLVFDTLAAAESYATDEVARRPGLRCRIYDNGGFIGAPLREFKGSRFRDNTDISPRFRRWGGSVLFFGGCLLAGVDWAFDFRWLWPSMLGTRMIMPGSILLMTELIILLHARQKRTHASEGAL